MMTPSATANADFDGSSYASARDAASLGLGSGDSMIEA
jgi:hypothetical protein